MRRFFSIMSVLTLIFALLAGCGQTGPKDNADALGAMDTGQIRLNVVSTIFPGYDFAREIGGDNVNLTMLLPPGSESHSFEPTPQDIITIQNCDVFLYVGGESDAWVNEILESMKPSDMKVISMMDLVEIVEEESKEGMEEDHDHENDSDHDHDVDDSHGEEAEYDEHVWTSPVNAMLITKAITEAFCSLDEENASVYRSNMTKYIGELKALDASFREIVKNASRKTLIFGDRFPFRYFVDEYGLDYYAAFPGCSAETEAGAKTVAFLIKKVKDEKIPAVFHIEFSNEKIADAICEGTGAKKLLFHSCHNLTKGEFESGIGYLELMAQNAENLKEALL